MFQLGASYESEINCAGQAGSKNSLLTRMKDLLPHRRLGQGCGKRLLAQEGKIAQLRG